MLSYSRRQSSDIGVKAVGVFHDEFAAAHQAETRPDLITKLGLDLVQIERQLAVGAHRRGAPDR